MTLNWESLEGAEHLQVTYPNTQERKRISEGVDTHRFTIAEYNEVKPRPGPWTVEVLDSQYDAIDSTEFVAERHFSLESIGTLAQQGVTGENEHHEYTSVQFTLANDGPMPIALQYIWISASFFEDEYSAQDGGLGIITADKSKTTEPLLAWSQYLDFSPRAEAEERAGNSYQAALTIEFQPTGEQTYPLTISFGDTIEEAPSGRYYIKPTEISFRD